VITRANGRFVGQLLLLLLLLLLLEAVARERKEKGVEAQTSLLCYAPDGSPIIRDRRRRSVRVGACIWNGVWFTIFWNVLRLWLTLLPAFNSYSACPVHLKEILQALCSLENMGWEKGHAVQMSAAHTSSEASKTFIEIMNRAGWHRGAVPRHVTVGPLLKRDALFLSHTSPPSLTNPLSLSRFLFDCPSASVSVCLLVCQDTSVSTSAPA